MHCLQKKNRESNILIEIISAELTHRHLKRTERP